MSKRVKSYGLKKLEIKNGKSAKCFCELSARTENTQNEALLVRFVEKLKHESCPERRFLQTSFRPRVMKMLNE